MFKDRSPSLICFFPIKEKSAAENASVTANMSDQPVSTDLGLSLFPTLGIGHRQAMKPCVDVCPSVWCFKVPKPDQEPPIPALPNHQEFIFTLWSSSTHSKPSTALGLFPMKRRRQKFLGPRNRGYEVENSWSQKQKILGPKPTKTENSSHSTITVDEGVVKKQRVENPTKRLRLKGDGHWIKKRLSVSDVNDSSRLLLAKEDMRKYVLPLMDVERCAACHSRDGLRIKIWDLDTLSEHELSLKQWKTGSFLLTSNWSMEFVRRRRLEEGDCIGLLWDFENLGFFFHKFN